MSASKIQALPNYVTLRDGRMYVDPKMLKVIPGYNVRDAFDPDLDDDDKALYRSMLGNGYDPDSPILCRLDKDGTLWIIRGHQRKAAAELAKVDFVTIALETVARDRKALLVDLITSNSGKDLAETEKGRVYFELSEEGMSPADIAKHCGIGTAAWIKKSIALAKGDPELVALVRAGWTAPTNAILLTGAHGEKTAKAVVKRAARTAKAAGRKAASNADLAAAELAETGTTKVTGRGRKAAASVPVKIVSVETETVEIVPETVTVPEVPHTLPVVPGVPQGGPFKLGTGKANCDLFDVSGRSLGAFDDVVIAKQMLILINIGWDHIGPKAATIGDKAAAPVAAVPSAPIVPVLSKAAEKAAAKARIKAEADKAAREAERAAKAAETIAKHEAAEAARKAAALAAEQAEQAAAAKAAKAGRKAAKAAPVAPLADVIAGAAIKAGTKGRQGRAMAAAMVNATPRKR